MEANQAHSVIFSPCGGTRRVVQAVMQGIPLRKTEHDITTPAQRKQTLFFGPDDLVVLGFPVYEGKIAPLVQPLFGTLRGDRAPAVLVAVYGNRAYEGALVDMERLARLSGFLPFAAAAAVAQHSLIKEMGTDRPDQADAEALAAFGRAAAEGSAQAAERSAVFKAPGAHVERRPFPDEMFRPETDIDDCTKCGACVPVCPAGAIPAEQPEFIDKEKCMTCMACVNTCPVGAKKLNYPKVPKLKAVLAQTYAERQEPVFFL